MTRLRLILTLLLWLLAGASAGAQEEAEAASCGMVDVLRDPLEPLSLRYDDFGIYRARFGGLHVGVDMGFGEGAVGTPVFAVAHGRVTYADPFGWDTEGGVIVLAHEFPDGSRAYSLYGHIVPEGAAFPEVGRCVEAGTLLARIGTPTLSAPHLHFEFRDFLPDDGGPGYVPGNPLEAGWFHPLDYVAAWRLRLNISATSAYQSPQVPSLPPVLLPDDQLILASGNTLLSLTPLNQLRWRLQSDSPLMSLAALPDGSVVAHSHSGQVLIVQGGRYLAIWSPAQPLAELPPLVLGEALIFATENGTLLSHTPSGLLRWQSEALENARPLALQAAAHLQGAEQTIALLVEAGAGAHLRLFAAAEGRLLGEWPFSVPPLLASRPDGAWWLYDGATLHLLEPTPPPPEGTGAWQLATRPPLAFTQSTRRAQLHALADGGALLFRGDAAGTLIAFGPDGQPRWEQPYPELRDLSPPLLASAADGCWLAALAEDGALLLLSGAEGTPLRQAPWPGALYPGGRRQRQPAARLLQRQGDALRVGAGYLSFLALDMAAAAELRCGAGG